MDSYRPKLAADYKESEHGVYDTRDLNAIHVWAKELTKA
jgi:hypothetical protein